MADDGPSKKEPAKKEQTKETRAKEGQITEGPVLTIGSKAPAIDIEHWINDGDGQYPHTTKLESGKIYVVEFWATWCGPCIASMPHLSEIQQEYADQDVQIISVSREPLETVEEFLEKTSHSDKEKTYRELTSTYCLTCDPDRSTYEDYFKAAGQTGIPCAFLVGKSGLIEWIGHPMKMDDPLDQVIEDKWDRESFEKEFAIEQRKRWLRAEYSRQFRSALKMADDGDSESAIETMDAMIQSEDFQEHRVRLKQVRAGIEVTSGGKNAESAMANYVRKHSEDTGELISISRHVYSAKKGGKKLPASIGKLAMEAAYKAVQLSPEDTGCLLTLARWQVDDGELEQAIQTTESAIEIATEQKSRLKSVLTQYLKTIQQQQKESGKDDDRSPDDSPDKDSSDKK